MSVMVAELQRQQEADRRATQRQLEHLERRIQEQVTAPAQGRERWADLQGSVTGMLEEMSTLARRVENLDEKLRLRTAGVEESVRSKMRELEQQLHSQQQKALLAVSTTEEMSKRQTARLRKISQSLEEQSRRLAAVEEISRHPEMSFGLEARVCDLETQQAAWEDELRAVARSAATRACPSAMEPMSDGALARSVGTLRPLDLLADDHSVVRALERDLSQLSQRTSAQLDEHAAALANLRVRLEGQEHRLIAAGERVESMFAAPLEALRAEVSQLRDHDRLEMGSRIDHLTKRIDAVADAGEETAAEMRERVAEVTGDFAGLHSWGEEPPALRRLMDHSVTQEQQLRRLEALAAEPGLHGAHADEDLQNLFLRLQDLEGRVDQAENSGIEDAIARKADKSELIRLEAAVQELTEPFRRLSQRTANNESRASALEKKVDLLQTDVSRNSPPTSARDRGLASGGQVDAAGLAASAVSQVTALSREVAEVKARLVELEALTEEGKAASGSKAPVEVPADLLKRMAALEEGSSTLKASLQQLQRVEKDSPPKQQQSSSADEALQLAQGCIQGVGQLRNDLHEEQARIKSVSAQLETAITRLASLESSKAQPGPGAADTAALDKLRDAIAKESADRQELLKTIQDVDKKVEEVKAKSDPSLGEKVASQKAQLESSLKDLRSWAEQAIARLQAGENEVQLASKGIMEKLQGDLKQVLTRLDKVEGKEPAVDKAALEKVQKEVTQAMTRLESSAPKAAVEKLEGELKQVLTRVEVSEAASQAVRESVMGASMPKQEEVEKLRSELLDEKAAVKALQEAVQELKQPKEPAAEKDIGVLSQLAGQLEHQVGLLQSQVADELIRLTDHQLKLSQVARPASTESSPTHRPDTQALEKTVDKFAEQVRKELQELQLHQRELGKAKEIGARIDTQDLEKQVQSLSQQVAAELQELQSHQKELRKALK